MLKTNFSGHNTIWGALLPNTPRGHGPVCYTHTDFTQSCHEKHCSIKIW